MRIVKIISTAIEKGRLIVKILGLGSSDVKTVYNVLPFGIDSRPIKNYRAIYSDTGMKGEKILLGIIFNNVEVEEGETKIYSMDAVGEEAFKIILRNTGNCELGGTDDNLSRHSVLETEIHQLRDDLNNLVSGFNQHMHPTAAIGPPSIATPIPQLIPASESNIDISNAKLENILTS